MNNTDAWRRARQVATMMRQMNVADISTKDVEFIAAAIADAVAQAVADHHCSCCGKKALEHEAVRRSMEENGTDRWWRKTFGQG